MTAEELRAEVKATSGVDVDHVDTLKRIASNLGRTGRGPRWSLFSELTGHGSTVSVATVRALGFDPYEVVGACPDCDSGARDCPDCDGGAGVGCEACGGEGVVICSTCSGTGWTGWFGSTWGSP